MTDTAVALPPIVFGTDGWRARVADEYTYEKNESTIKKKTAMGYAHTFNGGASSNITLFFYG